MVFEFLDYLLQPNYRKSPNRRCFLVYQQNAPISLLIVFNACKTVLTQPNNYNLCVHSTKIQISYDLSLFCILFD